MKFISALAFVSALILSLNANAAIITYHPERSGFEDLFTTFITDDYSAPGYSTGDRFNSHNLAIFSNSAMSAVLGETDYLTTGADNLNLISRYRENYCAGCNGSFELGFTTTSIGSADGVFGVGFSITARSGYFAFITLGDSTTREIELANFSTSFFGITATQLIRSIHIGHKNGDSTRDGFIEIDNLTIGSNIPVSSPPTGMLMALMLIVCVLTRLRKQG